MGGWLQEELLSLFRADKGEVIILRQPEEGLCHVLQTVTVGG